MSKIVVTELRYAFSDDYLSYRVKMLCPRLILCTVLTVFGHLSAAGDGERSVTKQIPPDSVADIPLGNNGARRNNGIHHHYVHKRGV